MFYFPHSHLAKWLRSWCGSKNRTIVVREEMETVSWRWRQSRGGAGASKYLELGYICFCNKHFWGRLLCSRHRTKYILCVFSIKALRTTPWGRKIVSMSYRWKLRLGETTKQPAQVTEFLSDGARTWPQICLTPMFMLSPRAPHFSCTWDSQAHWRESGGQCACPSGIKRGGRAVFIALPKTQKGKEELIMYMGMGRGIGEAQKDQATLCSHDIEPGPGEQVGCSRQWKSIPSRRNSLWRRQILRCTNKVSCVCKHLYDEGLGYKREQERRVRGRG